MAGFLESLKNIFLSPLKPLTALVFGVVLFFIILPVMGLSSAIWPPRILSDVTPGNLGFDYEDVSFVTEDGIEIAGWFIPSVSKTDKTVVALHGYPADKGNVLPLVSFLRDDYNLLLFDFRYLGESGGRYSTAGVREVKDLRATIEFLKEREVEEIGLWGFSVGGAVALAEASKHSEVKAVFSDSSYARLDLLAPEIYRLPLVDRPLGAVTILLARVFLGLDVKANSPEAGAGELQIPTLITHSRDDQVIPFRHALILEEALRHNERAEFWFREGEDHGVISEEYQARVREFFSSNL